MALIQLDGMQQILAQMDFSAFEQRQYLATCSLADPHLDIRVPLRVVVQELRQHAFDMLWRARDLQDSGLSTAEQLSLLRHGASAIEKDTAPRKQLLAFPGQKKSTPNTIEEPQTELVLEIHDLTR